MRISTQTKNAIRVLVYCARRRGEACRVPEIAEACGMTEFSAFKLMPVLVRAGFLDSIRGRGGGVRFDGDPQEVTLGSVIRATDPNFAGPDRQAEDGSFEALVDDATLAFTEVMDGHTVADLMDGPARDVKRNPSGNRPAECRPEDVH